MVRSVVGCLPVKMYFKKISFIQSGTIIFKDLYIYKKELISQALNHKYQGEFWHKQLLNNIYSSTIERDK